MKKTLFCLLTLDERFMHLSDGPRDAEHLVLQRFFFFFLKDDEVDEMSSLIGPRVAEHVFLQIFFFFFLKKS